ncbi:PTS sugar transporter subunit IIC [Enterococcus faecalis]|uniref:PTS mannose/fructose/sorbose/N-acetylgalactosamine transporter subunit IIC n=1 Tax=Enterococcus faecalis TaxID=1351 RepID=UPI00115F501C|nr:PTS sugar transporter subunit IIC [Enterococcus faecalis]EGO5829984.1 PTS sugar transporter subunit IIC [Enterococcus faecalis]EGO6036394.1 PTS sugar transporter subunit IIC [Enterococcus faecalis]EHU9677045.1 PTS sugar transporter subunit IIC [Enterococcus faecalis]EIA6407702.1 PTS sugar transporter subunit IIC [Enterococcus faecalis]EIA6415095.1 PTS sugar transporter subunit IIC [Enterococcus faecalis]
MLIKAILLALWGGFCMFDGKAWHFGFQKPLLAGAGAAIITGDISNGIIIAATLELMWLGTNNVGIYTPPDIIAGSIIGVSMGVLSGGGLATGIAVAMPSALLVQQLNIIAQTVNIGLAHRADNIAEKAELYSNKINRLQWIGGIITASTRIIPIFIVVYLGVPVIDSILSFIPETVLTGVSIASKMVAAVGFAMLLRMLIDKTSWVFLLIGYVLAAYLELPIIAVAILGIAIAYFYDILITSKNNNSSKDNINKSIQIDEEYDL